MKLPWRCIINIYVLQPYCVRDLTSTSSTIVLIMRNNSISVANCFAQKGHLGLLQRLRIRSQNSTLEEHPIRGFSVGFGASGNSVNTLRHERMWNSAVYNVFFWMKVHCSEVVWLGERTHWENLRLCYR
jgi:hypothetical protein